MATSVGIPASVFKSLGKTNMHAFKTFLGATVIDDVIGLIVLAIVSALAAGGDVTPILVIGLAAKAFGFLIGSVVVGSLIAKPISRLFSAIHSGSGMKIVLAISFALVFAWGATLVGLAPIVGAFAAGLLLDAVHFEGFVGPKVATKFEEAMANNKIDNGELKAIIKEYKNAHVEKLIAHLALVFVPVFFVFTGLQIEIESLLEPSLYIIAFSISLLAILAKVIAGIPTKGSINEKLLVGFSMVPRGEVGLIFAATGLALGAISAEIFSIIVLVVMITTFIAPPIIKSLITKIEAEQA